MSEKNGTLIGIEDAGNVYENSLEALVKARDAAWARLVKATARLHLLAMCNAVAGAVDPKSTREHRDLAPERDAVDAARQALRDLGVDVDELLKA